MKTGNAVRMNSCVAQVEFPEGSGAFTYKAPKGERFVFLLLGVEPRDGSAPMNAEARLEEWGWTPPPADTDPSGPQGTEAALSARDEPQILTSQASGEGE